MFDIKALLGPIANAPEVPIAYRQFVLMQYAQVLTANSLKATMQPMDLRSAGPGQPGYNPKRPPVVTWDVEGYTRDGFGNVVWHHAGTISFTMGFYMLVDHTGVLPCVVGLDARMPAHWAATQV